MWLHEHESRIVLSYDVEGMPVYWARELPDAVPPILNVLALHARSADDTQSTLSVQDARPSAAHNGLGAIARRKFWQRWRNGREAQSGHYTQRTGIRMHKRNFAFSM